MTDEAEIKTIKTVPYKRSKAAEIAGKTFRIAMIALLLIYCLTMLVPLYWMLTTSFKDGQLAYLKNPFGLPAVWYPGNYAETLKKMFVPAMKGGAPIYYYVGDMLLYSFLFSTGSAFFGLFLCTLCAYVVAKYKFRGRNFLYALGIVIMIIPIIGSLPSALSLKKTLHIYDNMALLILTGPAAAFSGLHFLIMHAVFKNLSWSYAEAVFIDGGGHYTVLFRIMLPMALPSFAVLFILNFLGSWSDYTTFLIWLPSYASLALGMYYFQQNSSLYMATTPEIMAGFTIVIIPTMTLFLLSQRLILSKFTVGGLKG